jgi:hypothetical protein
MSLSKYNNGLDISLSNAELQGREIYQKHEFFRRIGHVMEHPEFRSFFDKYLSEWEDAKLVISFLKTYSSIEHKLSSDLPPFLSSSINSYHKLYILEKMFQDPSTRSKLIYKYILNSDSYSSKILSFQAILRDIPRSPSELHIDQALHDIGSLSKYLTDLH